MDRQEYLNQISMKNSSVKKSKPGLLSSKFFWVGVIGVSALILIMIIGSLLSGNKTSSKDRLFSLILHIDNTASLVEQYQPNVKSSDLRSYSTSFRSVLSTTSKELTELAEKKYNFSEKNIAKNIVQEETTAKEELEAELFEAKINGILDRIYAHKMAYEIFLITDSETKLKSSSQNEELEGILEKSLNGLNTLYNKFNDFSETK